MIYIIVYAIDCLRAETPRYFAALQHNTEKGNTMANITQENAKTLAIAYAAYIEATMDGSEDSKGVWARILKKAQDATGVSIISDIILKEYLIA